LIRFLQVTFWLHNLKSESCPKKSLPLFFLFSALFSRLWRDKFDGTDPGRFANIAKVLDLFLIFDKHCSFAK